MKRKPYTFIVDSDFCKVVIDGYKGVIYEILIDHDIVHKIRSTNMKLRIQKFKGIPRVLYFFEDNKERNLCNLILGVDPRVQIAFKNGNSFDLQKENLYEMKTIKEKGVKEKVTDDVKGIYWHEKANNYSATVMHKRERHYLGSFKKRSLAVEAVINKRMELNNPQ